MDTNRRDREQHDKDLQSLNALHAELWNLTNAWMGLGIQRQRKEAIKIEQAVIRTRMADRLRLILSEEKKSDGEAVTAAPDHAHDQADGNFGGAANGYFEMGMASNHISVSRTYYRPGFGFRFTTQDRVFLKSLRITLDDPAESGTM